MPNNGCADELDRPVSYDSAEWWNSWKEWGDADPRCSISAWLAAHLEILQAVPRSFSTFLLWSAAFGLAAKMPLPYLLISLTNTREKQFKEGGVCLGSQIEGAVRLGKECIARIWRQLITLCLQSGSRWEESRPSPLCETPACRSVIPTFRVGFSPQLGLWRYPHRCTSWLNF